MGAERESQTAAPVVEPAPPVVALAPGPMPLAFGAEGLLSLQRTAGNQAVGRPWRGKPPARPRLRRTHVLGRRQGAAVGRPEPGAAEGRRRRRRGDRRRVQRGGHRAARQEVAGDVRGHAGRDRVDGRRADPGREGLRHDRASGWTRPPPPAWRRPRPRRSARRSSPRRPRSWPRRTRRRSRTSSSRSRAGTRRSSAARSAARAGAGRRSPRPTSRRSPRRSPTARPSWASSRTR